MKTLNSELHSYYLCWLHVIQKTQENFNIYEYGENSHLYVLIEFGDHYEVQIIYIPQIKL